ncbi:TolC family protein [candidate division KSB1 bacterium]
MQRSGKHIILLLLSMALILSGRPLIAQNARVIGYDEAIRIALGQSFTIKSYLEKQRAMEQSYNYNKAQFKPRIDISAFAPSLNETVQPVQRIDGLPVYNSVGTMQAGGFLTFTYMLPTGGNFALRSTLYQENLTTVLALQDYTELERDQAYSSLNLSFDHPIFTRNTLQENLEQARLNFEQSSFTFSRQQLDIVYNVTNSFYQVFNSTRQAEIAREKLANSEEAFRIASLKGETGRIPEGDVLIAEITVAQDRAALLEREGELQRTQDSFKQLIGLDLAENIQIRTTLEYDTFSINEEKAIEEAFRNRYEIQEKELTVDLRQIEVERASREREFKGNISAYYDVTGVSTLTRGSTRALFESSFDNFVDRPPNRGITLSFSYPVYDWGRGSARTQQEKANLKDAELDYENTKVSITREVRDIVRNVEIARLRLVIQERNQEIAQRSYAISLLRFENGDITSQELGVEQQRLANTQIEFLNAFITYQLSIADLKRKTLWNFETGSEYTIDEYLR